MDYLLGRHFISLFLILLFSIRLGSQKRSRDKELRYFWLTVLSCFLLVLEDQAETAASLNPDLRFWRVFFSVSGYILRSLATVSLVLVVCKPEQRTGYIWVPCIINILLCCTAFFTDLVFGFDAEYRFYRGPLGYVPFIVPLLYLAAILWLTFSRFDDSFRKSDRVILVTCALFCLFSALLDASKGGVRLHEAIMISCIFFYVFLRSYDIRRDSLTLLLSRQSLYDDCLSLEKNITATASLDMNGLKAINAAQGHPAGDQALKTVGESLLGLSGRHTRSYRIGADEFVVLFFGMDESGVRETLEQIAGKVSDAGYSIAFGYAMREKGETPGDVINRSDTKMFEHKAQYYREKSHDRRRRAENREDQFSGERRKAFEESLQPVAAFRFQDHNIVTVAVSDGYCSLFGFPSREQAVHVRDQNIYRDIHPDDQERYSGAVLRFSEGKENLDLVYRTAAGMESGYRVIHACGTHSRLESGSPIAFVWYMNEGIYAEEDAETDSPMTQSLNRALREESILHATYYDNLTRLPNLTWFFDLFEAWKAGLLSSGDHAALLYIDLNGMRVYNHKHGFAEGDNLLKAFALLLVSLFGKDNCCHITAGHFAAAVSEKNAEEKIRKLFADAARINGGRSLPVLVGLYSASMEDVPASTAYDRAKAACDAIRKSGASAYNCYDMELREAVRKERYLLENIDRAVAERWIQPYYQPIVRCADESVCDEEALARWIDPVEGFLSPADFVPLLEKAGLIYKLDLCVLDQVLEKIQALEASGMVAVPQSVNLSRSDFETCDIVEEIRKRVDAAGVERKKISVEITESIIGSNFDFMREQILRFRELGFPVWMDDFGSGYSSLDVLQSIPFDLIKFDMSFMRKLDEGENGKIILTALMKMASALRVDTICEGVETESQVRFLQEIGCSKMQGYFFGKPQPLQQGPACESGSR